MNTEFPVDVEHTEFTDIGRELKNKRLELGLGERQIASELKLPIEQVRALEDNRFDYFRSKTFARGYLRNYIRVLQMDERRLLEEFDTLQSDSTPELQPIDKDGKQAHLNDPIVILISVVIIAVLIFLAFWWPTMDDSSDVAIADDPVVEETSSAEPTADEPALTATPKSEKPLTNESESSVASSESEESEVSTGLSEETLAILRDAGVDPENIQLPSDTKEVVTEPEAPAEPEVPVYTHDVEVQFSANCWVEIKDAQGTILFSGVKSAGSDLTLSGSGPYRVVLGYAPGVSSFKYKGEVFDFSSYIRKDLARFELK